MGNSVLVAENCCLEYFLGISMQVLFGISKTLSTNHFFPLHIPMVAAYALAFLLYNNLVSWPICSFKIYPDDSGIFFEVYYGMNNDKGLCCFSGDLKTSHFLQNQLLVAVLKEGPYFSKKKRLTSCS